MGACLILAFPDQDCSRVKNAKTKRSSASSTSGGAEEVETLTLTFDASAEKMQQKRSGYSSEINGDAELSIALEALKLLPAPETEHRKVACAETLGDTDEASSEVQANYGTSGAKDDVSMLSDDEYVSTHIYGDTLPLNDDTSELSSTFDRKINPICLLKEMQDAKKIISVDYVSTHLTADGQTVLCIVITLSGLAKRGVGTATTKKLAKAAAALDALELLYGTGMILSK